MRLFKIHPLLKLVNSYVVDSPQPSNLSYWWNFGSLLAFSLIIQIVTGVTLAMHYNTDVIEAFNSVEHIMRDINNGWLIRYLHSNTASAFFFIVYLHIGRGLYYGSYRLPRTLVWTIGTIIFISMMATAFLGYVLPFGQMSLWGATVITSLMSAIPWVGQDVVEFIWGGFSVNHATLNRFFALHFVLPFVLAALALTHLIVLHDKAGSGNPLGISANPDRLPFAPYYIFKDLITIFIFILVLSIFVFYMPNILGDSENYVMANPMRTPASIVPEWYLLPFYAILRSIPNKLLGVIAMFSAILMLLVMAFADVSRSRGIQFKPISKVLFFIFVGNFLSLTELGAEHVEYPFIEIGQISTILYFTYFLIIVPYVSSFENGLTELLLEKQLTEKGDYKVEDDYSEIQFVAPPYAIKQSLITIYPNNGNGDGDGDDNSDHYNNPSPNNTDQNVEGSRPVNNFVDLSRLNNEDRLQADQIIDETRHMFHINDLDNQGFMNEFADDILSDNLPPSLPRLVELGEELKSIMKRDSDCDAPRPWGIYFQDSGTAQMEALVELHDNILFYLIMILYGVVWLLLTIIIKYGDMESPLPQRYASHGTTIEIIWTITPGVILILIAFPSFKLLYLMDEITDPLLVIFAQGHQWYWSYQYIDYLTEGDDYLEFDSYLVPTSDLESGALRMLEVDNRLVLPEFTHIRFMVSGADVIHSMACPALGLKCDAYPGRLNQSSLVIGRIGTFYGQCSEICGILHSSMPIVFEAVTAEKFVEWLIRQ